MTVRNVSKNLAAQQDMLLGVGPHSQMRQGQVVTLDGFAKSFIELWKSYIGASYAGTFEDGCDVTVKPAVVLSLTAGKAFAFIGSVPYHVNADSTLDIANWVEISIQQSMIAYEIARRSYAEAGLMLVQGSLQQGGVLTSAADVILDASTGRAYGYVGSLPHTVIAGTNPLLDANYVDKSAILLRSALASDAGDTLVAGKGSIAGEVKRTQSDRNADEKNIFDFGGKDDCVADTTGTNNFQSVADYFTYLAAVGGVARFPKRNTGGYYINGSQSFSNFTGVELVVDEGVYFVFDGSWTPIITKGIKCNREVRIHIVSLDYNFYLGPNQYKKPSEVMPAPTQKSGTYEVPKALLGTAFGGYILDTVNGRDVSAVTTAADYITITPANTSQKKVAVVGARIGDEVGFTLLGAGSGTLCVGVVTAIGYALVEQRLSDMLTVLNKNTTLSTVYVDDYAGTRNQFNAASLAVQIISDRKFAVLVNDITIGMFDAGAAITGVAVGEVGTVSPLTVGDLYRVENAAICGSRPLKIVCLGDSTSDPGIPCSQFDYMKQFLAAAGCQVAELNNLAVSGETSAQQLARLNSISIAQYDFCIASVGVNDIQGGVPVSNYIANMEAIADLCSSNGVKLIASVPTFWYPRAEAVPFGQTGQDTLNSQSGAIYRNRLRKSMAGKGQLITSSAVRHEGVVAAKWLANAGMDPVIMDNIHPTAYGRMMMGLGHALAVIGAQNPVGYRSTEIVTMPNRWKSSFTIASVTLPALLIKSGELTFLGSISVPSVPSNGTVLLVIDKELCNGTYTYRTATCQSASGPIGMCNIVIDPSGNLSVYAVPAGTTNIVLDGVVLHKLS